MGCASPRAPLAGGEGATRYIRVQIGAVLAKKLCLQGDLTRLRLQFGTGSDAGKIAASVDVTNGGFEAKKDKQGRYALTINQRTADGLFALDFPAFTVSPVDVIEKDRTPPVAVFTASDAMLAVED